MIRTVFDLRLDAYFTDVELGRSNPYKSPTFEALNACNKLGLLDVVRSMTNGSTIVYGKKKWSNLVWERAWKLDDAFWKSINTLNPQCNRVSKVLGCSRYMFWWIHSDGHPEDMKMCETVCHQTQTMTNPSIQLRNCIDNKVEKSKIFPNRISHNFLNLIDLIYNGSDEGIYIISIHLL